jgi:hypothetical protein
LRGIFVKEQKVVSNTPNAFSFLGILSLDMSYNFETKFEGQIILQIGPFFNNWKGFEKYNFF